MPLPALHRGVLLPVHAVGSRRFEDLCCDLVFEEQPDDVVRASLKRKSGVAQYGVDVEGFDADGEPAIVVSAKCYGRIEASYLKIWLAEFTDHLDGHWKGRRIRYFVLAVATETNDDGINEAAREAAGKLKPHGIEFRLWNANTITRGLRRASHLVDRYFHRAWIEAISADPVPAATPVRSGSPGIAVAGLLQQAMVQVETMSDTVGKAVTASLEAALKAVKAGKSADLRRWLQENRGQADAWAALDPEVRARGLRAVAMLRIHDDDVAGAGELLDEADGLSSPSDASWRARYLRATDGPDAALDTLRKPRTAREREAKATILIEAGQVAEADVVLSEAEREEITPEILRLRSIVRLLNGRLAEAAADARSAVERSPEDLAPLLTSATVRFHSTLVPGARPQVGRAPEPIQPGLVREGATARAELSAAADEFGRVAILAEDDLKPDIEVWRLAALVLNPARFEEGVELARALIDRPLPNPLAIAWASSFGIVERLGRLKRVLGVALRDGTANESHLVVLALLCAGDSHPARGLAQIRRYQDRFPKAADFLEGWRARFGDPGAAGEADHAAATRRAVRTGDYEPLIASALADQATVETILTVAELLAWRGAWAGLDRIRSPLSALPSVRMLELASLAALRTGDFLGCLSILEAGARSIESAVLPRTLVHLRIAANEALGRHEPLLADLLSLRRDGDEAATQDRIMDAYVRIGDLDRLRQEVERALDRSSLDPSRALSLAYVLRASAPSTARRALLLATEDSVPPEAAGAVLGLAYELAVPDLREAMMKIVLADPAAHRVTGFERVEDVIVFMEKAANDHRERFGEWRKGRTPFALATTWDIETLGRMFLAEPAYRWDRLRETFPMLLMSARRTTPVSPPLDGTTLRPDLGSLLLASRLGLLADLEAAFPLQVPVSAAEALTEMEVTFRRPSREIIAGARDVLDGRGAVRVVGEPPSAAVSIESDETPGELDGPVVRTLLERAHVAGHLDRETLERVGAQIDAPGGKTAKVEEGVRLTRSAITRLAGAGVLQQVARATPCYISTDELRRLRSDVDDAVEQGRLRDVVEDLRRTLALRLSTGAWTTASGRPKAVREENEPPAHVRCVLEVLAAHAGDSGWLWIEDRALSHQRLDGAVQLPELIQELHRRGIVGPARKADLLRELRRLGYAYLPLEVEPFLSAIRAASSSEEGLIETTELSELRKWLAREIELLAEIEPREEFDEEGRVAGESRRLLDIWGLARDLLVKVWEEPNSNLAEREARSIWIWTNLRVDRVLGWPSDTSPATRRTFRALGLANLLDMPLLAMLDQTRPNGTPWREFIEWTMAASGRSLLENDRQVRESLLTILKGQLADLLVEPTEGSAKERRRVEATFAKLVRDYLDLLPEDLSDALTDDARVGPRLGTRSAMVMTVGSEEDAEGVQGAAPLLEIVEAYRGIISSGRSSGKFRLLDGRHASIEVEIKGDTRRVSFVIAGRRTVIEPVTVALLSPASGDRRIPREERDRICDANGTISTEDVDAVEATEDADERFAALQRFLDGNLDRTLRLMGGRSASRGNIRLSDFELPPPDAVLAHFRVPPGTPPDTFVATAWSGLDALPHGEISRRIASVPLASSMDQVGPSEDSRGAEARTRLSPMLAAFDLRRSIAADAGEAEVDRAVETLVTSLGNQAAFQAAVIRHLGSGPINLG